MNKILFLVFMFAITVTASAQGQGDKKKQMFGDPNHFEIGVAVSEMTDSRLDETSGIAASIKNPGYLWAHNDSGNAPEIYLVDKNLKIVFTAKLKGVFNRDWEDMAVGPGPEAGKSYIYVADIGDNLGIFPTKVIYRFEEPAIDTVKKLVEIKEMKRIIFKLPKYQTKDSEAMLLDPISKNLYILSKEDSAKLFEIKYPYNIESDPKRDTVVAEDLGAYNLPKVTSGAVAISGEEILVRNYRRIWYWKNPEKKPLSEILKIKPIMIPYDMEPQGEAISWAQNGTGFYTLSEKKKDKKSFLYFYKRK
ncbi:hypothetical protein [Pseudochryseolinea flava]|uniref:PE-PGRS family protein n=1 Tax=Pseudochryseolinea flava TaxID=2059302 RepID=A0A364Y855_9BACT|nr:hypothetical protein [Pseudochryseolinea flava]RAW03294.1 hypothetical protein DQQ10_04210 [Pseudochryseolinea flava]